jgi:uncharacterized protein (TIGR00252 family)
MTNFAHGRAAEDTVSAYLEREGYEIISRNWRTRWCEIDIVAKKKKVIYFVEVKYRKTDTQGSGLDYVTPKKLQQMRFATEFWVQDNNWRGDYRLAAIEVGGPQYEITNFLTEL